MVYDFNKNDNHQQIKLHISITIQFPFSYSFFSSTKGSVKFAIVCMRIFVL